MEWASDSPRAAAIHTPDRKAGPWNVQRLGARVREVWSDPRAKAAVDFGEMNQGEVREETAMGYACGGKPGSHGSKAILLSHA